MLTTAEDLEKHLHPVLRKNGFEIPVKGTYAAAVEFDEAGEVVAYQMVQNALFLEGLWARDASAHLLSLYREAMRFAEKLGAQGAMTMTRADEQGSRIGRIAQALGFERMSWVVYRRKQCR